MVAFLGKICLNYARNGKSMSHSRLKFVPLQPKYKISCQMDLNSLIAECTAYDFKVMHEGLMADNMFVKIYRFFVDGN